MTCGNFRDSVMADNQGEFSIALPATHPGGPYTIVAESKNGGDKAMLENVLFGDVFLCGGQSNMQVNCSVVTKKGSGFLSVSYNL